MCVLQTTKLIATCSFFGFMSNPKIKPILFSSVCTVHPRCLSKIQLQTKRKKWREKKARTHKRISCYRVCASGCLFVEEKKERKNSNKYTTIWKWKKLHKSILSHFSNVITWLRIRPCPSDIIIYALALSLSPSLAVSLVCIYRRSNLFTIFCFVHINIRD